MTCWICRKPANSGEHKIKNSDLKSIMRTPSKSEPVFYHDKTRINYEIGAFKRNKLLKSPSLLCAECNNKVTQPYDHAREILSKALRSRKPALKPGDLVCTNRIFPYKTHENMRDAQLFFTKLTGCHLMAGNVRFDKASLADSILRRKPSPYIYLKFCISDDRVIGMSDLQVKKFPRDDSCAFAVWFYCLGTLAVQVMYAVKGEKPDGLVNAWHPSLGTTRLLISDFF